MKFSQWGTLRSRLEHRVLFEPKDWIQIEVTSRCNAACVYCPRTVYRENWRDRDISLETFARITPSLHKIGLVYLQGWGEPLLHPHFFELAVRAKEMGCRVGTTTNGRLVDTSTATELVRCGIDILAFSLAGSTPAYNDHIRKGAPLDRVLESIQKVREARIRENKSTPTLHVAHMLLRSGIGEIEGLPALLARQGVEQVVISSLDLVASQELAFESIHSLGEGERDNLRELLLWVHKEGKRLGVQIHTPSLEIPTKPGSCTENIQGAFFVSADGRVSPCVYTNVPVSQGGRSDDAPVLPYKRNTFGDVNETWLPVVWRGEEYTRFRKQHASGQLPWSCRGCLKIN